VDPCHAGQSVTCRTLLLRHLCATTLLLALPRAVMAQGAELHLYGPEGSATERRVLAVFEGEGGACIPWDNTTVEAVDDGVSVVGEATRGECARWLRVVSEAPRELATVRVEGNGQSATATIGLGSEGRLPFRISRNGSSLTVFVSAQTALEQVTVHAFWSGGSAPLEPSSDGRYSGEVPSHEIVGVVVRSGSLVGASVSVPAGAPRPEVTALVMPSELAVQAGGAPRTAAFLVVTNSRGRLSNAVPLNITSQRGRLRAMRWQSQGLAAIQLSAEVGVTSVDLTVSHGGEPLCEAELPVSAGWPAAATIDAPESIVRGESIQSTIAVTTLDGEQLNTEELRLRCGGDDLATDDAGSVSCRIGQQTAPTLVAGAMIDGRFVPLASRSFVVLEPPTPPAPEQQPLEVRPEIVVEPQPREPRLHVGPFLQGGLDLGWLRGSVTVGARLEVPVVSWFHVDLWAHYSYSHFNDSPAAPIGSNEVLAGAQHNAEIVAAGGFELFSGRVTLVLRGGFGVAFSAIEATLGDRDVSGNAVRVSAVVSVGPRFHLGRATVGAELGARVPMASTDGTWPDAVARVTLEVSVVFGVLTRAVR